MKSLHLQLFIIGIMLLLTSCSNLYVQKSLFVPILKEKGEFKSEISLNTQSINLNTAFAATDHFSLMLNGFSGIDNNGQTNRSYNMQLEGGIGFNSIIKDSFHFESFIGMSSGKFDTYFERAIKDLDFYDINFVGLPGWSGVFFSSYLLNLFLFQDYELVNARGNYQSYFFQNSFSILSGKTSTSFTARLQYTQFNDYNESLLSNGQRIWYSIRIPPKIFFQPALTNKFRINDRLNFVGQFGFNIPLYEGKDHKDVFVWNNSFLSIGLEAKINTKHKK